MKQMIFPSKLLFSELSEYERKCLDLGMSMKDGEVRVLDKKSPSYPAFIQAVKKLRREHYDHFCMFEFEFNGDYTKLRKIVWTSWMYEEYGYSLKSSIGK